ncbi:MAG: RluA family pseudouridine synthase [Clostridiales bacterium]|nr:RluA family pseudouridine synthase [Clostridiales bacterium]
MRKITAKNDTNIQTLIRSTFPQLGGGVLRRAFEKKDIKINSVRCSQASAPVKQGDVVEVFIDDKYLFPKLDIVYSDERLVIIDKPQGMETQGEFGAEGVLSKQIEKAVFPVHRLDATTGGLLIFALDEPMQHALENAIKDKTVSKYYRCVVKGRPKATLGKLEDYLFKDAKRSLSYVCAPNKPGAQKALLEYRVIENRKDTSLLEIKLITGRTHQIRVQTAHAGFPLLGDDKYGDRDFNRRLNKIKPQLCAVRLVFEEKSGELAYLLGKTFSIKAPF